MESPVATIRVSEFYEDLALALRRFSPDFIQSPSVLGNTRQFWLYNDSEHYLMTTSQQAGKVLIPQGYNCIVAVSSFDSALNDHLLEEVSLRTGINLRTAPKALERMSSMNNPMFLLCEIEGKKRFTEMLSSLSIRH
ncbi:MAG: hypothetical protein WC796_04135 [Candidatus Pacearchaeota archaeon]|jgi:hypothetical protein